jgi:hypothetical protein
MLLTADRLLGGIVNSICASTWVPTSPYCANCVLLIASALVAETAYCWGDAVVAPVAATSGVGVDSLNGGACPIEYPLSDSAIPVTLPSTRRIPTSTAPKVTVRFTAEPHPE